MISDNLRQSGVPHQGVPGKKKKRLGKCHICGENTAKFTCIKCGKPACSACYFHLMGLCKKCLSKSKGEKWKGLKPDWEKTLGVEWID